MCGLAGIYVHECAAEGIADRMEDALRCIAHRGPDDEGIYHHGRVTFGHKRLSILDTSPAGHQPFTDQDGRHTIIYNGEVFNFPELRADLVRDGHTFRSHTDTEVLLRLYIEKGPAFLHDLNGFFALAIHDAQADTVFIARDRFGVKPLLWAEQDGRFFFASELRALERLGVTADISPTSLRQYFTHHYIPAPYTIQQGVHKLLPGHSITLSAEGHRIERWYHHEKAAANARNIADPVQYIQQLLEDAVRIRLLSDVPVGTFLSGGLDSSIISALAKKHKEDLRTFSIGYEDPYFDETPFAEQVARAIGSDHTTFTLGNEELAANYLDLLAAIDEPFADSSALPAFLLSKYTREHVVVALSGDGADEVFGGYRKHQAELRTRQPGLAEQFAKLGAPLWAILPHSRNNSLSDRFRQLDRFAHAAGLSPEERYLQLASFEQENTITQLIGPVRDKVEWDERRARLTEPLRTDPGLNGLLWADVHNVLPNDMLHKVDLTSMAFGLEVRTPFLDHRLVSYAFSLPPELKFKLGDGKHILRKAFAHLLPPEILSRSKKGFEVPLRALFLGPLKALMDSSFDPDVLKAAGVDPGGVSSVLGRLKSPSPGSSQATVHALLVYLSWWKKSLR